MKVVFFFEEVGLIKYYKALFYRIEKGFKCINVILISGRSKMNG